MVCWGMDGPVVLGVARLGMMPRVILGWTRPGGRDVVLFCISATTGPGDRNPNNVGCDITGTGHRPRARGSGDAYMPSLDLGLVGDDPVIAVLASIVLIGAVGELNVNVGDNVRLVGELTGLTVDD